MTSVAYPVEPQLPGWGHTGISLVVGWVLGLLASVFLYGSATLVGAISRPYGASAGVLNEWPYADNGYWSLFANLGVVLIAVLLTAFATAWWMRRKHAHVSEGRLAVVLLFTGWVPLASKGPFGGLAGFLVAVVLLRHWVARHDDHLPLSHAAALVAPLAAVVLSYGLLHPLWTAQVIPTASAAKQNRSVEVLVHNAARAGVTIENLHTDFFVRGPRPSQFHLAPGADGVVVLSIPGSGGCGTAVVGLNARYHVFGLSLSETLPVRISLGRHC